MGDSAMRRTEGFRTISGSVAAACLVWGVAALPGCGGDAGSKQAKTPTTPLGDAGAPAPVAATPPPSGDNAPDQHADVSGAAKSAYEHGWSSWRTGDLQGAKAAFMSASQQDAHAPAPHYALGVVLERLGNLPDAQQEYRAAFTFKPDYEAAIGAYALSLAYTGHAGEADTFPRGQAHAQPAVRGHLGVPLDGEVHRGRQRVRRSSLAQDALKLDPNNKDAMVGARARLLPGRTATSSRYTRFARSSTASTKGAPRTTRTTQRRTCASCAHPTRSRGHRARGVMNDFPRRRKGEAPRFWSESDDPVGGHETRGGQRRGNDAAPPEMAR